ncbi:MAG: DUF3575 domain-containing protein [Microscillaceae bacterium]|jgi:hypothetical protein|nr:DUF3575 domain-containing protein [Microscillaceae bacterium]
MKKLAKKSLILCLLIFSLQSNYAQTKVPPPKPKRNLLKMNLLSPFANSFSLAYERVWTANMSWQITGFVAGESDLGLNNAWGITPELRFYLSDREQSISGFFVAPYLRYMYGDLNIDAREKTTGVSLRGITKVNFLGTGVTVGRQWIFKNRISLDVWGGPGYHFRWLNGYKNYDINTPYLLYQNFTLRLGCTLGVKF